MGGIQGRYISTCASEQLVLTMQYSPYDGFKKLPKKHLPIVSDSINLKQVYVFSCNKYVNIELPQARFKSRLGVSQNSSNCTDIYDMKINYDFKGAELPKIDIIVKVL